MEKCTYSHHYDADYHKKLSKEEKMYFKKFTAAVYGMDHGARAWLNIPRNDYKALDKIKNAFYRDLFNIAPLVPMDTTGDMGENDNSDTEKFEFYVCVKCFKRKCECTTKKNNMTYVRECYIKATITEEAVINAIDLKNRLEQKGVSFDAYGDPNAYLQIQDRVYIAMKGHDYEGVEVEVIGKRKDQFIVHAKNKLKKPATVILYVSPEEVLKSEGGE